MIKPINIVQELSEKLIAQWFWFFKMFLQSAAILLTQSRKNPLLLITKNKVGVKNSLESILTHFRDRITDFRFGVHTNGIVVAALPNTNGCGTLPYSNIMQILSSAGLTSSDTFIDIGCGRGRVICCASLFPVKKTIGIEIIPEHWAIAHQNVLQMRGRHSPIEVLNQGAEDFDYDEGTIFYLYNPFNAVIMNRVLSRIHQSLQKKKRAITIIYANPVYESCLSSCSWLTLQERWEAGGKRGLSVPVTFWSPI
jgi:SAM-dependent methyltransferase